MPARKETEQGSAETSAPRKRPEWQVLVDGERKPETAVVQSERAEQRAKAAKAKAAREKARAGE